VRRSRAFVKIDVEGSEPAVAELAPASAVHWTGTMDDALTDEYAPSRFYAVLIAAFSTTGLGLMAIGLFVVLSHAVARRAHEISLRVALGCVAARCGVARARERPGAAGGRDRG